MRCIFEILKNTMNEEGVVALQLNNELTLQKLTKRKKNNWLKYLNVRIRRSNK